MPLRAPCAQVAKPVSSRDVPPRRIEPPPQPSPESMVAAPLWVVIPLGPKGASQAVAVTTDAMRRSADTIAFGVASADEELCQTPRERGTVQAAGAQVGGPMTYCKPDLEDAGLAAGRATGSRRALVTGVVGTMRCTEPVKAVPARGLGVHGEECAPRFGPEQGTHCWGGITAEAWIGLMIWRTVLQVCVLARVWTGSIGLVFGVVLSLWTGVLPHRVPTWMRLADRRAPLFAAPPSPHSRWP